MPALSLPAELHQEADRRAAVRLDHQQLQSLTDKLICDWYRHKASAAAMIRRIAQLEAELALATAPVAGGGQLPITDEHLQWAQDLLGR